MFRKVLFTEDYSTACLIRSLLVEAGFHPAPVAKAEHVFLAGADRGYYVEVFEEEAKEAVGFLAEHGYRADVFPPRE